MMILTVTLNPAIDKNYRVERLVINQLHHPTEARSSAGGKGINVARVLVRLGREALATGFVGGFNGKFILQSLTEEGIPADFVWIEDESRLAIGISETSRPTDTKLDEWGPTVQPEEIEALKEKVKGLLAGAELMVLSGSPPPSVPPELYAELIRFAHAQGVRTLFDAHGGALKAGMEASPFMVKPNRSELEDLRGSQLDFPGEALEAARALLVSNGISWAAISSGKQGCLATDGQSHWSGSPPEVPFVSAVGSGDALAAGFAIGLVDELGIEDSLRLGVACAAANVSTLQPGMVEPAQVERLTPQIQVSRLGN